MIIHGVYYPTETIHKLAEQILIAAKHARDAGGRTTTTDLNINAAPAAAINAIETVLKKETTNDYN